MTIRRHLCRHREPARAEAEVIARSSDRKSVRLRFHGRSELGMLVSSLISP
jgi:hypothetical protein